MWLDAAWVKKRADISYFHPIHEDKQNLKNFEIPKIKNDEGMFFQDFLFSDVSGIWWIWIITDPKWVWGPFWKFRIIIQNLYSIISRLSKGPCINDVRFFRVIFDPPSPLNPIFTFYNPIFLGHFRPPPSPLKIGHHLFTLPNHFMNML